MHVISRLQRLLALITLLLAIVVAVPLAGMSASYPLGLFVSSQTGYFFFWDAATYAKTGESSDPDRDSIRLQSDEGVVVDSMAFIFPGMSPDECVQRVIDSLLRDVPTADVEALSTEAGPPRIEHGFTELVLTIGSEEDHEKFAVHLECEEIVPQQSLVVTSIYVPARLYNERGTALWRYDPLWFSSTEIARVERQGGDHFVVIPDLSGQRIGTFAAGVSCARALEGSAFVLARNVAEGSNLTIDPSSFAAVSVPDETLTRPSFTWWLPAVAQDAPLVLSPGETALFQVEVASEAFDLSYTTFSGQTISLGTYFWACGAGGAAPVLIDIE